MVGIIPGGAKHPDRYTDRQSGVQSVVAVLHPCTALSYKLTYQFSMFEFDKN